MRFAYFIKKPQLAGDAGIRALFRELEEGGACVYDVADGLRSDTDLLLSFGGDGTFMSAARYACEAGVPILGVNLGRLGFLSDAKLEGLAPILLQGTWKIEKRRMLWLNSPSLPDSFWPYAVNEITVFRSDAAMLGIDVSIEEGSLPTCWSDGLLVSTSSGSTAYSLSVGGPICTPELDAFVVSAIAPHNLNIRPLVIPGSSRVLIKARNRNGNPVLLTLDNRTVQLPSDTAVCVGPAPFPLKRATVTESTFTDALRSKLFWGEDVRNR